MVADGWRAVGLLGCWAVGLLACWAVGFSDFCGWLRMVDGWLIINFKQAPKGPYMDQSPYVLFRNMSSSSNFGFKKGCV